LFVVTDREEGVARIHGYSIARRSLDDLGASAREPLDLDLPLRLERRRADDKNLANLDFADTLDGLAEAHLVREDRAPGTGRERDAVELERQQRLLQQRGSQWVLVRRAKASS